MSFTSTRYHVDKLSKAGEIIRVDDGGYTRMYHPSVGQSDRLLLPMLRKDTDRKILAALVERPLWSNKQLSDLTGLAKSTVSEHLSELVRLGIVKNIENGGPTVLYDLHQSEQIRELLSRTDANSLKRASERFIDLWDF